MNMNKTLQKALEAALNNGYTAVVDTTYGHVTLGDDQRDDWVFLQGDEAYNFIDEAKALYEEVGGISIDAAYILTTILQGYDELFTEE